MSDLTAVDIMIQPDAHAIERAREVNRRMPLSIPAGITLDDTHLPHITMLQRYLITADLDQAYAAIEKTIAATDVAALSYHVPGITYSEHWGPPGQAAAVLGVHPNQQVLDLQAALLAAVTPFHRDRRDRRRVRHRPRPADQRHHQGLGRDLPTEPGRRELHRASHRRARHRHRPQGHAGRTLR